MRASTRARLRASKGSKITSGSDEDVVVVRGLEEERKREASTGKPFMLRLGAAWVKVWWMY